MVDDFFNLSSKENRALRLKRVRGMSGLTVSQFCEGTNLSKDTFNAWEQSRFGGLTLKGALKVIIRLEALGIVCSSSWLLDGKGYGPEYKLQNSDLQKEKLSISKNIKNEVENLASNFGIISLTLEDDSMTPLYLLGDVIVGLPILNFDDAIGLSCIVRELDGSLAIRFVQKGTKKKRYSLLTFSMNPDDQIILHDREVLMIAPVIRVLRSYSFFQD